MDQLIHMRRKGLLFGPFKRKRDGSQADELPGIGSTILESGALSRLDISPFTESAPADSPVAFGKMAGAEKSAKMHVDEGVQIRAKMVAKGCAGALADASARACAQNSAKTGSQGDAEAGAKKTAKMDAQGCAEAGAQKSNERKSSHCHDVHNGAHTSAALIPHTHKPVASVTQSSSAEIHLGDSSVVDRLAATLKERLQTALPVAIVLRGPPGSGKHHALRQAANRLDARVLLFGPHNLRTKSEFDCQFAPAARCPGFNRAVIVVVEMVQHLECLAQLLKFIREAAGTVKKKPRRTCPIVLIADQSYQADLQSAEKFCLTLQCAPLPLPLQKKLLLHTMQREGLRMSDRLAQRLVTAASGNMHTLLNQGRLQGRVEGPSIDLPDGSHRSLFQRLETCRWGTQSDSLAEGMECHGEFFLDALVANIGDNRTEIDDCSDFLELISLQDRFEWPDAQRHALIQLGLAMLPQGQKQAVRLPERTVTKSTAGAKQLTPWFGVVGVGQVHERMSFFSRLSLNMSHSGLSAAALTGAWELHSYSVASYALNATECALWKKTLGVLEPAWLACSVSQHTRFARRAGPSSALGAFFALLTKLTTSAGQTTRAELFDFAAVSVGAQTAKLATLASAIFTNSQTLPGLWVPNPTQAHVVLQLRLALWLCWNSDSATAQSLNLQLAAGSTTIEDVQSSLYPKYASVFCKPVNPMHVQ